MNDLTDLTDRARELRRQFELAPPVPRQLLAPYILPLLDLLDTICQRLEEPHGPA